MNRSDLVSVDDRLLDLGQATRPSVGCPPRPRDLRRRVSTPSVPDGPVPRAATSSLASTRSTVANPSVKVLDTRSAAIVARVAVLAAKPAESMSSRRPCDADEPSRTLARVTG
jgi:hypothetical protein